MRYLVTIVALLVVAGGLGAIKGSQIATLVSSGKAAAQAGPPPEAVATTIAREQEWDATLSAVGTVTSAKAVSIGNDAPGVVTRISFDSGARVKQGDVLVELDASVERAQLASAIARRELAATNANRTRKLVASGAAAPSEKDTDESQLEAAAKEVDALRAQIARKIVRAPFSGRLGIRAVNLGQYLAPGTPIAILETSETLFVDFTLPQEHLGELALRMPVRVTAKADAGAPLGGEIHAIDPAVDPTSRAVKVRATVPDPAGTLRTGMFVTAEVVLPRREPFVVVPATAILHAPYGDSVFVVEDKPGGQVARQQFVRTAEARGDFVAIREGVKPGQTVVTAGAFKLRNGARVHVDNSVQPTPELRPTPANR